MPVFDAGMKNRFKPKKKVRKKSKPIDLTHKQEDISDFGLNITSTDNSLPPLD